MQAPMSTAWSSSKLHKRLADAGILPTLQRLAVGSVILQRPTHMTAEQVLTAARERVPGTSRATVYGTLQMFVRHGLLRELLIDNEATVYDSNMQPHHHLYHVETGEVEDLPEGALRVAALPELDKDLEIAEVDVILRVRRRARAPEAEDLPAAG